MTTLEAINTIIAAIGSTPVTALGTGDAVMAEAQLNRSNKALQAYGWAANTTAAKELTPDGSNEIALADVLAIQPAGTALPADLTIRNSKLFNRSTDDYTFTGNIIIRLVKLVSFEHLPEALSRAIVDHAAHAYAVSRQPSAEQRIAALANQAQASLAAARIDDVQMRRLTASNPTETAIARILDNLGAFAASSNFEPVARRILGDSLKAILSEGWSSNTIASKTYSPDGSSEIPLTGVLRVERSDTALGFDVAIRNGKLYDRTNDRSTFTGDVTVRVIESLDIDQLPEALATLVIRHATLEVLATSGAPETGINIATAALNDARNKARQEDRGLARAGAATATDQAIDEMLEAMRSGRLIDGPVPTSSLESEARTILLRSLDRVLTRGWTANTSRRAELSPDENGEISLTGILAVRPHCTSLSLTIKGGKLYNVTDQTAVFASSITATLIRSISFEDLPPKLATYVIKSAQLELVKKFGAARDSLTIAMQDAEEAQRDAVIEDGRTGNHNILNEAGNRCITGRRY